MTIGDTDPEDVYDASNPIPDRVANLVARLAVVRSRALDTDTAGRLARLADDLDLIGRQLAVVADLFRYRP